MVKKCVAILMIIILCLSTLSGCNTSAVIDNQVDDLVADYFENHTVPSGNQSNVVDTLDLMLDNYISGIQKPDFDDVKDIVIEPDDKSDLFDDVDADCSSIDEMKAFILKGLTETADEIDFYIPTSIYSSEILYDVIFNQICEEYMIETMGMQSYTVATMVSENNRLAVNVDFSYFGDKYSIDEVKEMKKQSLAKAKDIIQRLDLANKTEYECVAAVNQYLCDNCVYPDKEPYTPESHSIYGALIEKSAVCEGYARTAELIFSLCNLDSYYVVGDTSEGGHAWNLVKVEGKYYQLDITWNDNEYQPNAYLLVTDSIMAHSRTWDKTKYPASATLPYSA